MKKPLLYVLTELFLCLLLALLPFLLSLWPQDAAVALAFLCSHILYPAVSFLLPLWCCRKGASAFVCALIPFLVYLPGFVITGLDLPALPTVLTLVLAVLGANTGAEIRRRKER